MGLSEQEKAARVAAREGCVGIDVSKWQVPDDLWGALPTGEIDFVVIKFSQNNFKDGRADEHHKRAGEAGLLRGAYHFLDHRSSGEAQARTLLGATQGLDFELPLVLDLEALDKWPSPDHAGNACADACEAIAAATGRAPWLYTGKRHLDKLSSAVLERLKPYSLWLASYWKNVPPIGTIPSAPRGFSVVCHQWCSDNQLWRREYNRGLDTNFSMRPIAELAAGFGGAVPRYPVDEAKATEYNERENATYQRRAAVDVAVGADPWDTWSERLQRIAAWQDSNGLTPDGMVGPGTREKLGIE